MLEAHQAVDPCQAWVGLASIAVEREIGRACRLADDEDSDEWVRCPLRRLLTMGVLTEGAELA